MAQVSIATGLYCMCASEHSAVFKLKGHGFVYFNCNKKTTDDKKDTKMNPHNDRQKLYNNNWLLCPDLQQVKARPGEDVTLQCMNTTRTPIEVLKWIRPDLKSDGFVLFYRDKVLMPLYQHPSFTGRVELRRPDMKDGDVSVILKDVTVNDTGTYESHVSLSGTARRRRTSSELRCIIHLSIEDSGGFQLSN